MLICATFPSFIKLANCSYSTFNFINLFLCHLLSAVIPSSQYVYECPQSPYTDAESPEAGVTVTSELFDVSAGYQTQVLLEEQRSHPTP